MKMSPIKIYYANLMPVHPSPNAFSKKMRSANIATQPT
jgi:hypothetical protein